MSQQNLGKVIKVVRATNAVVAGAADANPTVANIDMQGYDGVLFIVAIGTLLATQVTSLKAQDSSDGSTGWADLAGTKAGPMADADSNKTLVLDVYRPVKRYIRPVVSRATANAVIDGVIAILYKGSALPVPYDATTQSVAVKAAVSPAAGTP